jgi:hypothetical protein
MTVTGPLKTIEAIERRLSAMPAVAEGFRRVLRGQVGAYSSLIPAEYRSEHHPRKRLLKIASQMIIGELANSPMGNLRNLLVWTELIAQQYGSGSPYLDVTDNLDVALWFALHKLEPDTAILVMGPDGPINAKTDRVTAIDALIPKPSPAPYGVLYVMDVRVAAAPHVRIHGELIDLSALPAVIADSRRIQGQHASLVWSDKKVSGGDLSQFIVGDPIQVSADLRLSLDERLPASLLFPHPEEDPWYHRLLSIPLTLQTSAGDDELSLKQTIPVPLYCWDPISAQKVTQSIIALNTPVSIRELREVSISFEGEKRLLLALDTITILAEEPFYAETDTIDSRMWSQADAVTDLPRIATVMNPPSGEGSTVSLDQVYFEFSPLELGPWHHVEDPNSETIFHNGAYVERLADSFLMWRMTRTLPHGPLRLNGPYVYRFDQDSAHFLVSTDNRTWFDAEDYPARLKTLLVCLNILRPLSETPILDACAYGLADDHIRSVAKVGGAHLRRASIDGETVYLLRRPESDEIYSKNLKLGNLIDYLDKRGLVKGSDAGTGDSFGLGREVRGRG